MTEPANVEDSGVIYDTVIAGGELVDPAAGNIGRFDVAIKDGKIAAVGGPFPHAGRRIDAHGQVVTPGLIDIHTHIYWGATYWGIEPDPVAARTGVTTWVDAGSSGGYSFPGFREYIANRSASRVLAFLNLSSIGLIAPTWELANPDYWDIGLAVETVERNRDLVVGIKARIDARTTRGVGIEPLARARELADRVGMPLMTHIGTAPPEMDEVIPYLRPGDILTHCFTWQDMSIADASGRIRPEIRELQEQGLILDVGHGTGSFGYGIAEAMYAQGILPDVISTDIHQLAVQGPMFDLPTTLSKFLTMGMNLPQVIACATVNAARAIRREDAGTLAIGSRADVALFRVEEGEQVYYDVQLNERVGSKRLVNTMTLVDGEDLPQKEAKPLHFWSKLTEQQQPILLTGAPGARIPAAALASGN